MEQGELNYIIGRNTVREAVKSGRSIDAVYYSGKPEGSLREILALAKKNHLVVKEVPKNKLDEIAMPFGYDGRTGNHQGIAAQVAGVQYVEIDDMFARAEERGESVFLVALDGVTDPGNLGAIVRSAEVMGAHGVILPSRRSAGMTAAACKTASGAEEYIPIARVGNLAAALEELKRRGVWVACADMEGQEARKTDLTGPLALVIGSEGEGISHLIRQRADYTVKIEVRGRVDSLNASAAAAVLMYEKVRQEAEKRSREG